MCREVRVGAWNQGRREVGDGRGTKLKVKLDEDVDAHAALSNGARIPCRHASLVHLPSLSPTHSLSSPLSPSLPFFLHRPTLALALLHSSARATSLVSTVRANASLFSAARRSR